MNIEVRRIKTNEYDAGVVAEQEPEASSFIEPTTLIGLRIADGRISDFIPNLTGQPLSVAEELEELGWAVSVEEINSDSVADGRVVSTLPQSGTDHDLDETKLFKSLLGHHLLRSHQLLGKGLQ